MSGSAASGKAGTRFSICIVNVLESRFKDAAFYKETLTAWSERIVRPVNRKALQC